MKSKITLVFLFFNTLLFCNNPRQTESFYIELPEGWIQIPGETVQFLIKEVNRPALNPVYENYSYLYQNKSKDTLFTLPYMLIQVSKNGRPDKSELAGTKGMKSDKDTGYLWSIKDSVINVIIPTEQGTINIICVSSLQDFNDNKAFFKNIINSMIVALDITYKDDFIHNTPVVRDIVKKENFSTILFFILIAVVFAARVYKRKMVSK